MPIINHLKNNTSTLLSIAPMINWTYSYFRVFMRILAPRALLYTEMQTPSDIHHHPERALYFDPMEQPIAFQIGGADKNALIECAKKAEQEGFIEFNLNLGCPSDNVQAGRFGACLMAEPAHVADCIDALKNAVNIPITAKTRIGIDHEDSYEFFSIFAHELIHAGCNKLIVHARKAWLNGLSPKQNRTIPPLHYEYAYEIKKELPEIPVIINGNINSIQEIHTHLNHHMDGVMIGRLACDNPYAIAEIHHALYPECPLLSRYDYLTQYAEYLNVMHLASKSSYKTPISLLLKPIFNIMHGISGARSWKEELLKVQHAGGIKNLNKVIKDFYLIQ